MREKIAQSVASYISLHHVSYKLGESEIIAHYNLWASQNRILLRNDLNRKYAIECFKHYTENFNFVKTLYNV